MVDEMVLVDKAIAGSVQAFEKLLSIYGKRIYNYCYSLTDNREDAEDITQEVFVKVYRSLNGFKKNSQFSTWAYKIAHNACMDFHRRNKSTVVPLTRSDEEGKQEIRDVVSLETPLDEQVIRKERERMVHVAIDGLRPEYRAVITLRDIQGLSYDEISNILNIPLGTVKSYISRARESLKASLIHEINKDGNKNGL